jgi:hypothetical protein
LNIGSLEFEIVATGEIAHASPRSDEFFPDQYRQYPSQSQPPKDLQLESEQLAQIKAQWTELESRRQTWILQQQQWQAEQEISQQILQDTERRLNERSVQLDSLAAELEIRKSQLDAQSAAFESQNNELADQAAGLAAHAAKNNALSGELDARSLQLDAHAAELQAQAAELARRSDQLDAQAAKLEIKNREVKRQSDELETKNREVKRKSDELEIKYREVKRQSAELQSQSHNLPTRSAELESIQTELESKQAELESKQAELESKQAELESKQAELETERSQLEIEHNRWEESRRAREQALASRQEEMDQKENQLETLQARLHAEMEDWQRQLAHRQRERELCDAKPTEKAPDKGFSPSRQAPPVDGPLPPQSDQSPADSHDILQRLRRDIDKPEETDRSAADQTAAPSNSQAPAPHEEESVDDYMARLMQRIRSTQGELGFAADNPYEPIPSRPEPAPVPLETAPAPPPAPVHMPVQRVEPVEMSPHTVAPEKQVDISLLRDLAKYSAQNALGTHARWLMTHVMYSKLAVALMGGFAGIGLLCIWQLWFTNILTFFSAMMSFVVAVIWGAQYVLLTIKLLANGSDNLDSIQEFHQTSEDLKTPGKHHATSGIAGDDDGKDEG